MIFLYNSLKFFNEHIFKKLHLIASKARKRHKRDNEVKALEALCDPVKDSWLQVKVCLFCFKVVCVVASSEVNWSTLVSDKCFPLMNATKAQSITVQRNAIFKKHKSAFHCERSHTFPFPKSLESRSLQPTLAHAPPVLPIFSVSLVTLPPAQPASENPSEQVLRTAPTLYRQSSTY